MLDGFAAVAIDGAKGVGKTATAQQVANSVHHLDDPALATSVEVDPRTVLSSTTPVLLDEWQRAPRIWDAVRRAVDDDPTPGRFVLTGSARPRDVVLHSGAGRIHSLRMRPLTLFERGLTTPNVSFGDLLAGGLEVAPTTTAFTGRDYAAAITRSGFPETLVLPDGYERTFLSSYVRRVVEQDVADDAGLAVRSPAALRRWLTAYAAATATTASLEAVRDAATGDESEKPAKTTVLRYRDALEALWLVEEQPGWLPRGTRLKRASIAPKHHLVDPGLACSLLGVDATALALDGRLFGAMFESLVTQTVRVLADAHECRVQHLRTRGGEQEVDLVVERPDGRVLALEVKLGGAIEHRDGRHLRWLRDQLPDQVVDLAIVTAGPSGYRRDDGIGVLPLALLGP